MSTKSRNVYMPFLRRFTDERARDLRAIITLYKRVRAAFAGSAWSKPETFDSAVNVILEQIVPAASQLRDPIRRGIAEVLDLEDAIFHFSHADPAKTVLSIKEQVDLRRFLRAKEHFLANDDSVIDILARAVVAIFADIVAALPTLEPGANTTLTVPLIAFVPQPGAAIERVIATIMAPELSDVGMFAALQTRCYENMCRFSGVTPYGETRKRLIPAS
jgi:hypothetical protein